ncbi:MAG: diaminopimelate epimerase [Candidatus Neomarinimicrobiota bacterium]
MIPFTKAHGNGNDFIIFVAEDCPNVIRDPAFLQRACDRHKGVGADGVMILSQSDDESIDFNLDYHNADGSWETLCANGSRCAVQFHARRQGRDGAFVIRTGAGLHRTEVLADGMVRLQILPPNLVSKIIDPCGITGQHVDSGAPHFCARVENLSHELILKKGPLIRNHQLFQPRGVNVNLYVKVDEHTLQVRTYEKGVEATVLSCASGSTAAAYHAAVTGAMASPIRVVNPGGELLIEFDPEWQDVSVTGPVVLVYDSQLPDDF